MPYYIDYYYFILIVPVLFISLICQARVNSAYSKFSRLNNMNGLTLSLIHISEPTRH